MFFGFGENRFNLDISFPIDILVTQLEEAIKSRNKIMRLKNCDEDVIELYKEKDLSNSKCGECGEEKGVITDIPAKTESFLRMKIRCANCASLLCEIRRVYPDIDADGYY